MKHITRLFLAVAAVALATSCSTFSDDSNPYEVSESAKNLSGTWKLQTVTRNGIDITKSMDFTRFQLQLKDDGTYSIQNYLPFVVSGEGQWAVNDPQHPMQLSFQENETVRKPDPCHGPELNDGPEQVIGNGHADKEDRDGHSV